MQSVLSLTSAVNPLQLAPPGVKTFTKHDAPENTEKLPVRLVLCFDGTGDTAQGSFSAAKGAKSGTSDSIWKIYELTTPGPVTDKNGSSMYQYPQYFEGVATVNAEEGGNIGVRAKALFDGATGHGYLDILRAGYHVCCQQLQHGGNNPHEIFLYGFSRGAFIARALASFLEHVGLIKADSLDQDPKKDVLFQKRFRELLARYMEVTNFTIISKQSQLPEYCVPAPRIRVLGAFDTVKTVITLPVHNLVQGGIPIIDFKLDAPALVDHFRHALALNEQRALFNPSFWKSASGSSDRSYLEAWFFGYHHDIGGGDDIQGLALWPLQWILRSSMDYGLILDSTIKPYDILFTGTDNVIETPHEIALKMFDMIRYHAQSRGVWGLKLNKPFSPTIPDPREFFEFVTKPPYVKFLKPKVFVHPAAYLVFDVSSTFRIQVYTWKYFRRFLADRFGALPIDSAPWWEKQTIDTIVNEASAVKSFNLLVIGRPNSGKESIITTIFGKPTGPTNNGIHNPVPITGNDEVRIHYSNGFGEGSSDGRNEVEKFLEEQRTNPDQALRIHAIWYFHDCSEEGVDHSEEDLFKMNFGDLPVLVFLQNENNLLSHFRQHMEIPDGSDVEVNIQNAFAAAIDHIQGQLSLPKAGKYVHIPGMASEAPGNLLEESATCLDHDSVYISQIKAQRVEVKPKIALATEETIRAYTIWYLFNTSGAVHHFGRNKDPAGMSLSTLLMEPVLATFSMGFSDSELIKRLIGSPWVDLDKHTSGICDTSLPSYLLLICMLDTIIVMTYAVAHRDKSKNEALPVTRTEVEKACTWYAVAHKTGQATNQKNLHKQVQELLQSNGYPKNKSVAHLQMQTIALVEKFSDEAEKASTTVLAAAAAAVSGAVTGAISGVGGKLFGLIAK